MYSHYRWLKAITLALLHNDRDTRAMTYIVVKRLGNVLGGQDTHEKLALQMNDIVWKELDSNPGKMQIDLMLKNKFSTQLHLLTIFFYPFQKKPTITSR